MIDSEAKSLVDNVFDLLKKSKSIDDLYKILELKEISKYQLNETTYSKISFKLTSSEIEKLKNEGVINNQNLFTSNVSTLIDDPLSKLLYSLSWKNGDLKKISHIISGILNEDKKKIGMVFHQFGKYLSKEEEPIIDQHVIRAFAIYKNEERGVKYFRTLSTLGKGETLLIEKYIDWIKTSEEIENLRILKNYSDSIDRILFATGKAVKMRASKKTNV